MSSVKFRNRVIFVGMRVKATLKAEKHCIGPEGLIAYIDRIKQQYPEPQILLYSGGDKVEGYDWHDEHGDYENRSCYWVTLSQLGECFALPENDAEIVGNVDHKGRQLKGMKGKVIAGDGIRKVRYYFIELEEDVGGCSADGLGKAGHCVAISAKRVKLGQTKFKEVGGK